MIAWSIEPAKLQEYSLLENSLKDFSTSSYCKLINIIKNMKSTLEGRVKNFGDSPVIEYDIG